MITLESRPPNIEGQGEIRIRELVRNALRMRPDRIIVGEVRGAETLDMLQAMNTGHEGSLTTIHANTPRDALSRLETLVMTAGVELPHRAIREQISSAFDVLVQISRLVDGSRRVTHITEVLRMESDVITLQDLFVAKAPDEDTIAHVACRAAAPAARLHRAEAALPREDGAERRHPAADVLPRRRCRAVARPSARRRTEAGSEASPRHRSRSAAALPGRRARGRAEDHEPRHGRLPDRARHGRDAEAGRAPLRS